MPSTHGKVLDLFDNRYLDIQDVRGNVEPFPALVEYDEYRHNIIVYKMETNHDAFMHLIQHFTDLFAWQSAKEMWTWMVQWEVQERPMVPKKHATSRSSKKLRVSTEPPDNSSSHLSPAPEKTPTRAASTPKTFAYSYLDYDLVQEDDMLRVLLDIVQSSSQTLPNFIEILYQTIDFYEGNGHALKCALRGEIPSLWDFERHPVIIPDRGQTAQQDVEAPPRKSDLYIFEHDDEESVRLKYAERKFGLQPPQVNTPFPADVNMPHDEQKRERYFAACAKSRERAIRLLADAGVTVNQMKNYKRGQEEAPKDTSQAPGGFGLKQYLLDKPYWEKQRRLQQEYARMRAKENESRLTGRLNVQAFIAERNPSAASGQIEELGHLSVPLALIAPTPSSALRPDVDETGAIQLPSPALSVKKPRLRDPIEGVPSVMEGNLKSSLFTGVPYIDSSGQAVRSYLESTFGMEGDIVVVDEEPDDEDYADDGDDNDDDADGDGNDSDNDSDDDGLDGPSDPMDIVDDTNSSSAAPPPPATPAANTAWAQGVVNHLRNLGNNDMATLFPVVNAGIFQALGTHNPGPPQVNPLVQPPNAFGGLAGIAWGPPAPGNYLPPMFWSSVSQAPPVATGASLAPGATQALQAQLLQAQQSTAVMQATQAGPVGNGFLQPPSQNATSNNTSQYQQTSASSNQNNQDSTTATVNHSTLSPGFQNLSFGSPSSAAGPSAPRATSSFEPALAIRADTPQYPPPSPQDANFSPARPGIQRNGAPSPIKTSVQAATAAIARLNTIGTPVPITANGIPVLMYFPELIAERQIVSRKEKTDVVMLGYMQPGNPRIDFTTAIFLPTQFYTNLMRRVQAGGYTVLETYPNPMHGRGKHPVSKKHLPHHHAYKKVVQAYSIITDCENRERDLTKRWRTTQGPMKETMRGSVWEGWAATIDRRIGMSGEERKGALVSVDVTGGMSDGMEEDAERLMELQRIMDCEGIW